MVWGVSEWVIIGKKPHGHAGQSPFYSAGRHEGEIIAALII
jgi:hypothetical protein